MQLNTKHDPVEIALAEDIGSGDLTASYFIPESSKKSARIFAKETAVLAGMDAAEACFRKVDDSLHVERLRSDGNRLSPGDTVMRIVGPTRSIVTAERTALNFLQRLSGIATLTARFIDAVRGYDVRIMDTRKTTPCLRLLEKQAVLAGGGTNHRLGLYDMVMVKDNHLLAEESGHELQEAIGSLQEDHPDVRIELEADTLGQVERFAGLEGVDVILLDNMSPSEISKAVELGGGRVEFEASGGVSLETVKDIAATGVDCISVGALTHSAKAIDFSLELARESA